MQLLLKKTISFGLYPFLLIAVLAVTHLSIHYGWDFKGVYWKVTLFILATLIAAEFWVPLNRKWSMTWKSLGRDLRYMMVVAPTIGLTKAAFGWWTIGYSQEHSGPLSHWPVPLAALVFLLVFELFQYTYHRFSHSAQGPLGRFLWKAHLAHHLPDKVYVIMHPVFHPVNALIFTFIIQMLLLLLGLPPAAVLGATMLIDLQSLISHFNVDIRAGWLNYIFIGTETHRYHHSAKVEEAKNFGNTLAIWDIVFGTFHYRPGKIPEHLGLAPGQGNPKSEQVLQVLALPFRS